MPLFEPYAGSYRVAGGKYALVRLCNFPLLAVDTWDEVRSQATVFGRHHYSAQVLEGRRIVGAEVVDMVRQVEEDLLEDPAAEADRREHRPASLEEEDFVAVADAAAAVIDLRSCSAEVGEEYDFHRMSREGEDSRSAAAGPAASVAVAVACTVHSHLTWTWLGPTAEAPRWS